MRIFGWFRRRHRVSLAWLLDHERREMGQGVELPCINWDAMKSREMR